MSAGPGNDIWFATSLQGGFLTRQLGVAALPQTLEPLRTITGASGGLQFGSSVRLTLDLIAGSPEIAQSMFYLLRMAAGSLVPASAGVTHYSLALAALKGMQVTPDGPMIYLTAAIPEAQMEQALALTHTSRAHSTIEARGPDGSYRVGPFSVIQ